jgi:hypothetical protein
VGEELFEKRQQFQFIYNASI